MRTRFIRDSHRRGAHYYAVYRCRCSKLFTARRDYRSHLGERTCGCAHEATRHLRHLIHGMKWSVEYAAWQNMLNRCRNPRTKGYPDYGARGIRVCRRWREFPAFIADMGPKPTPAHSLDRINNGGNYTPANCRWATHSEQMKNRRPRSEWRRR